MHGSMKLRYRILLGYTLAVFLFAAAALMVYTSINDLERLAQEVERINTARLTITEMESQINALQSAARGVAMTGQEDLTDYYREKKTEIERLRIALDSIIVDRSQRELLAKLNDVMNKLFNYFKIFFNYSKEDQSEKALELFRTGVTIKISAELREIVTAFHNKEKQLFVTARSEAVHARDVVKKVLGVGSVLVILASLITGFWTIRKTNNMIGAGSEAIFSSSKEIAAAMTQHERTVITQAAMVNETNVTVEELSASARQSADQAGAVADSVQRASGMAEEGSSIVQEAIQGMTSLKENVGAVAEQILRLSEQTDRIGNIANVVKDLAVQTNMLALNAAVEATRAGEHGKGFAVVAGEVRKLADQSKKSAEEAYRIVSEIQKAGNSTIMVTEESLKTVEEVASIAGKVRELFDTLSQEADQIYEGAQQVVLNARQQSAAINQIGEAMSNITASSKETAAGITQTKHGVQNLEDAAHNLQQIV